MIGLGLIGGSIALGLRERGLARAAATTSIRHRLERGASSMASIDAAGLDPDAAITFVAVPVLAVADQVKRALAETAGVVTDVGSVKASDVPSRSTIRASSAATRWPAASSTGSTVPTADMFNGAVWVLTPGADTDDAHVRRRWRAWSRSSAPRWWRSPPSATTRWSPSSATCRTSPRRP